MEGESKNLDVCSSFSLIDFSCNDDFLLVARSSDGLPNQQSSGTLGNDDDHSDNGKVEGENADEGHCLVNSCNEMEKAHGSLVSAAESNKNRKPSKCNLRKSLAWDNAFFTSEGILDPDELEIVSKTFKKSQLCALPGIQEDLRKSTESTTTLSSDASALESLEVELFEDIRASIQKSGYDSGRISDSTLSRSRAGQREPVMACPIASKKEQTCHNKIKLISKPSTAYKRQSLSQPALEKIPKEVLVHPRAVPASSGELNSSLKPPKILPKVNPPSTKPTKPSVAPTKKMLPSSEYIKTKTNVTKAMGNGKNQRSSVPSKKPDLDAEPSIPPSSMPSPTSCSSGSSQSAKTMPTTPSTTKKSGITKTLRNRNESRNGYPPSKDLIIKTPVRSSKSRMESGTSHLTAYVISASKVSPTISPASSFDGFSSESSSSTCTASQMSDSSKASLDISCASFHGGDLLMGAVEPPDQTHIERQSTFPGQSVERASFENGVLSLPAAANGSRTCTNYNSMQKFKPSGLRMPSPKIGFFDADKNSMRTSNAGLQLYSGLQSGIPKKNASGINSIDGILKQRPSKLQHAKPLSQFGTMKFNSHVSVPSNQAFASSLIPAYRQHPQQLSSLSPEPSGTPKNKCHLNTNIVVQDSSAKTSRETKSKARELQSDVADKGKYSKTAKMNTEEHGDQNVITRNILVESNNESTLEKSTSPVLSPVAHKEPATKLAEENFDSMRLEGEHVLMGEKENITVNTFNSSPVAQQLIYLQ